jgi:hypothetical protein
LKKEGSCKSEDSDKLSGEGDEARDGVGERSVDPLA